jgi:hypothetical protein
LSELKIKTSVSGLGLDVGQNLNCEATLNPTKPFLNQREYALLSTRYTKPIVLENPSSLPCWGRGFHRVIGHNFHIDPNLYLFHFGNSDLEMIKSKFAARDGNWKNHLKRRTKTIDVITNCPPSGGRRVKRGWGVIKTARILQSIFRPFYAWNKPGMLGLKWVVKIPQRFRGIV